MDKKKCIHKMNMKGHGDPWCTLFRKAANCDDCHGVAAGTNHERVMELYSENSCRRKVAIFRGNMFNQAGQKSRPIKTVGDFHVDGTLRDAVGSKSDEPIFTKHHETMMSRSKAERMKQLFFIYGGSPERMKQLQRIKSLSVGLQMDAAQLNYKNMVQKLIGRPGVTLLHDEFLIDEKEWVSPFTEGELVTYRNQLARVIKITGPVVKIKLQSRRSVSPLDVMDWDIKKRSIVKWVKKLVRKLWLMV